MCKLITWCMYIVIDEKECFSIKIERWRWCLMVESKREVRFEGGISESCFENSAIRDPIVRFTVWLISGWHFSAHRCRPVVICIGQEYRLYSKNDRTRASLCVHASGYMMGIDIPGTVFQSILKQLAVAMEEVQELVRKKRGGGGRANIASTGTRHSQSLPLQRLTGMLHLADVGWFERTASACGDHKAMKG